jgi:hypothetical protein
MNAEFLKEHENHFSKDLNNTEVMAVIVFISKSELNDNHKRLLIQQFLLNWITVSMITDTMGGC